MAWTVPIRWSVNTTVTAAQLNTHLRDNLNASETATVSAAGDIVYATAQNALTRLAAGSARTALMVASGGTTPEWKHSFYPIEISAGPSILGFGNTGQAVYSSPSPLTASFMGENDSVFLSFFATILNNSGSTATLSMQLRLEGTTIAGYWIPDSSAHTTSATCRGGWYSAWIVGKGTSTSRNIFMMGPHNSSLMPLLGATTDVYFTESSASLSTCRIYIYLNSDLTGSQANFTIHQLGLWGMRAI